MLVNGSPPVAAGAGITPITRLVFLRPVRSEPWMLGQSTLTRTARAWRLCLMGGPRTLQPGQKQ